MLDPKTENIVNAAFRLFQQLGLKKVTMSDIAEAAGISRPTLYAAFPNKEAVYDALGQRQMEQGDLEIAEKMPRAKTVHAQLALVFDVWILDPFASVIDAPGGLDLLSSFELYAPVTCAEIYARFEDHLVAILAPAMKHEGHGTRAKKSKGALAARDLAHILTLATRGLKTSTKTLAELRRMTDGLITMAVTSAAGPG